jgi:hypothetical protein
VLHQTADEDRRGLGIERHADALAGEILRGRDKPAVHDDETVTKDPRGENRQCHEGQFLRGEPADIFRAGHFAGVEFEPVRHPVENLAWVVYDQKIEVDAIGFDVPRLQRQHAVIEAAGEGHRQARHCGGRLIEEFAKKLSYHYTTPAATSF